MLSARACRYTWIRKQDQNSINHLQEWSHPTK